MFAVSFEARGALYPVVFVSYILLTRALHADALKEDSFPATFDGTSIGDD